MMTIVWMILGIISLVYGFMVRSINSGSRTYLMWFALAVILFFFAGAAYFHLWRQLPRVWKNIFLIFVSVGLICFIALEALIVSGFSEKGEKDLDYIIVLGAQVTERGPSVVLKYRLDEAIRYLKENERTLCIVSGGKGDNEHISEAQGMYDYLVSKGIPQERILKEDQSKTTAENLEFSSEYLDKEKDRVGLVSNNFHIYRAAGIAMKSGYKNICGIAAYATPLYQPNNMTREAIVLLKDLITGKMTLHGWSHC